MKYDLDIKIDEICKNACINWNQSALRRPEVHTFAWKMRICTASMGDNDMRGARTTTKKMDSKFNTNF